MRITSLLLILSASINLRQIIIIRATPIKHVWNCRYNESTSATNQTKSHNQKLYECHYSNGYYLKYDREQLIPANELSSLNDDYTNNENSFSKIQTHKINSTHYAATQNKHLPVHSSLTGKTNTTTDVFEMKFSFLMNTDESNTITSPIQNESDQFNNNDRQQQQQIDEFNVLLISQSARNELAKHIFNELIIKNLTDSLDTSPIRLNAAIKEALSSAVNEPNILLDNSSNALSGNISSSGFIGQSQASLNNSLLAAAAAAATGSGSITGAGASNHLGSHISGAGGSPKPYFGDALYSFQSMYWPIHCVICLIICTLGIFANVTNIIVLTRPNMVTAVNNILSAMAVSDLIVNISNIPYLAHELSDSSNITSFFSFQWAVYILVHAHVTVTAHTISIWLTCVLATWRYFVVCRSQSSNQRNWSVGLAKRTIFVVSFLVPVFCIPNYLSFAISNDVTESNITIYKVGFSTLANNSHFIKTFHFWIFSCLTKLVPCILLTFFTTALIRKLLSARDRRIRLTTYGTGATHESMDCNKKLSITSGQDQVDPKFVSHQNCERNGNEIDTIPTNKLGVIMNSSNEHVDGVSSETRFISEAVMVNSIDPASSSTGVHGIENNNNKILQQQQQQQHATIGTQRNGCNCTNENELIKASCGSSTSGYANGNSDRVLVDVDDPITNIQHHHHQQQQIPMSQLFVESTDTATISTTTVPPHIMASCDIDKQQNSNNDTNNNISLTVKNKLSPQHRSEQRSASTCGNLESYSANNNSDMNNLKINQQLQSNHSNSSTISSQVHSVRCEGHNPNYHQKNFSEQNLNNSTSISDLTRHGSFKLHKDGVKSDKPSNRSIQMGRSVGSITISPVPMVRIQAAQRQISHNETTTRLLIAVMIVFLICEFPSGILAALCAVLGQEFFENVYQPTGILMDLLALVNSSVNFILYCFMSTQFRVTFYQVVLHCPAPIASQQGQTILMKAKDQNHNNHTNDNTAANIGPEKTKNKSRNDY